MNADPRPQPPKIDLQKLAAAAAKPGASSAGASSAGAAADPARGRSAILFSIMLSLERAARRAPDVQSLRYVIVNETRRLLPYRQAALAEGAIRPKPVALSDVPGVERTAPYVTWLERVLGHLAAAHRDQVKALKAAPAPVPAAQPLAGAAPAPAPEAELLKPRLVTPADLPQELAEAWPELAAPHALLCPLADREGQVRGWLWLARDPGFAPADQVL
ncbi:MAG TPA: multidrug resistance protein mdtA, partial [Tistrella mobilis]|nr:multidrug resistance protein mdtA [Tistrella mobilis]